MAYFSDCWFKAARKQTSTFHLVKVRRHALSEETFLAKTYCGREMTLTSTGANRMQTDHTCSACKVAAKKDREVKR